MYNHILSIILFTPLVGAVLLIWCAAISPVAVFARRAKAKATDRFGFSPSVSVIARCARSPSPNELKKEVEESLRAFAQMQRVLKEIAQVNLELFRERKRQRP